MVTFNCEVCNATVPKKQTEKHYYRCPQAYYTCIDCNKTFDDGYSYQQHTQCISEDEKYQGKLYKGKNKNTNSKKDAPVKKDTPVKKDAPVKKDTPVKKDEPKEEPTKKDDKKDKKSEKKDKKSGKEDTELKELLVKGESLYKIMKKIDNDKDLKKKLLKSLVVNASGEISL